MAKILIVDDDKDISELMKIVLEKEKFEVSIINNPKLVIDDSNLKEYNLILLDIMMPEISGTELCAKIRTSVACPIVFVSAKKDDKIVELTTKEFELLSYLVKNKDIALSKEQIFESVWGSDYGDIGTIAVNIKSLRDKLDKDAKYIITIWGYGYKFVNGENNDQ